MKTKQNITEAIVKGVSSRGLRLQLLTQSGNEIPAGVIRGVNQITNNYSENSIAGRVLASRIIASAVNANGVCVGHNPGVWNIASSALEYARKTGGSAYNQMLERLVRCCSLPLSLATPHIYSLATFLLSKGVELNFERLYWDLYNWEDAKRNIPLAWASAYCDLREPKVEAD